MGKSKVLFIILVFIHLTSWAQDRYVIYFSDKDDNQFSISNPNDFLSERSILRRENQGIAVSEEDLPLSQHYIDSLEELDVRSYFKSKWLNAVLVEMTAEKAEQISTIEFITEVEFVAPGSQLTGELDVDFDFPALVVPSNTSNYTSTVQNGLMAAEYMHSQGFNGEDIWIAVFDSGFEGVNESSLFAHVKENGTLKDTHDFIYGGTDVFKYDSHGSNTWSCIAGKNDEGYVGTAYQANFSLYVTEDIGSEYRIEEYNWLFAAERADSAGVDIINSSLGYTDFDHAIMDYTYQDADGQTAIVSRAAELAAAKGILVVSSAGNSGNSTDWPYISMPADASNILSVGSVNSKYKKSGFSSIGPTKDGRMKPEVVALGESVVVLSNQNKFVRKNGTSFSSPLVAGFAAGVWQMFPSLTSSEIRELIIASARSEEEPNHETGYGIPNYRILIGESALSVEELLDGSISIYPNPTFSEFVKVVFENKINKEEIKCRLFSPSGRLVNELNMSSVKKKEVVTLDFKEKAKGIYLLQIEIGSSSKKVKILRF